MLRKLWGSSPLAKMLMLVGAMVVLIVFAIALTALGGPPTGDRQDVKRANQDREQGFSLAVPSAQRVAGFVESYAPRVEETEREIGKLTEALKAADERQKKQEAVLIAIAGELKEARSELNARAEAARPGPFAAVAPTSSGTAGRTEELREETPRIQKIRLQALAAPSVPEARLPAGSFAEGTLLTGVFAPVEGQALPVLIRLSSEWTTPDRGRVPIGDAFLIGKAQGDANSERATVQLEKLSYVHTNGRTIELPINGFIVDTDGIQGAKGKYVWRAE